MPGAKVGLAHDLHQRHAGSVVVRQSSGSSAAFQFAPRFFSAAAFHSSVRFFFLFFFSRRHHLIVYRYVNVNITCTREYHVYTRNANTKTPRVYIIDHTLYVIHLSFEPPSCKRIIRVCAGSN